MILNADKMKAINEIIEISMTPDLDMMTRLDIKDHFKIKVTENPAADAVETADFITDYIYEKYLGTEVQAMISPQIVAKDPVLLMRQKVIAELKK